MTPDIPPLDASDSRIDWERLARYVAGESPDDEAREVREWLAAHPADAAVLAALDQALQRTAAAPAPVDVEAALRRVKARRDEPSVLPIRPTPGRAGAARATPAPRRRWAVGGVAAAAAALIAVGVARWREQPAAEGAVAARTLTTPVGGRDSLTLPDGSRVLLGPASRLVMVAGYGGADRQVELQGVAWFTVRHDSGRPFVVRAGGAVVRDIGTAFTVRTDAPEGVAVAVTEGAVALRSSAPSAARDTGVVLAAGDRGVVNARGETAAARGAVVAADTAWRQGRLVFREAALADVRIELRRWYGVELRVDDAELARRRLTASFEPNEPVARVLQVIALALGAEVERRGNTALLRPATAPRR